MTTNAETKRPRWLFWCDLETTGLDPQVDVILELAFQVTEFPYPYLRSIEPSGNVRLVEGAYLVTPPTGTLDYLNPFVREMHEKSGLLADLACDAVFPLRCKTSLETIENDLLLASASWPEDKGAKVMIAGNSVGTFDLQFIRKRFPEFAKRLSHLAFDASGFYRNCLSLGMSPLPKPKEAHRAMADLGRSIELARECGRWVRTHRSGDSRSDESKGHAIDIALSRTEAVALHAKLVKALWNVEPRADDDSAPAQRSETPVVDPEKIALAKAVLAAHEALDIDMGDGEKTWQCCNTVCGHGTGCLIEMALLVASKVTTLTQEDVAYMNRSRVYGCRQDPIPPTPEGGYPWRAPLTGSTDP